MSIKKLEDGRFIVQGRASYPHLFEEREFNGSPSGYGVSVILDKAEDKETIKGLGQAIMAILRDKNKGKKLPADKLCLRDGDDSGKEGYEGSMFLSANSKSKPFVIHPDGKTHVRAEEDGPLIYGGCYVTVKVGLWFQDNQFGKRVNCELVGVQKLRDGPPFGDRIQSADKAAEGFEPIEGDDPFDAGGDGDDLFGGAEEDDDLFGGGSDDDKDVMPF